MLRVGDQWHLGYVAIDHNSKDDNDCYLCYASSKDGVNWGKPSLGIYSYNGNTDNHILLFGFILESYIYDEKEPYDQRFKGVGVHQNMSGGPGWVYGATSPDGIHWKALDEPLLKKNSDTGNICLHDGYFYRLYVRMWSGGDFKGHRMVGYTESCTFGDFPDPVVILDADKDDKDGLQFYNSATSKLKNNMYLMFPSGLFTKDGIVLVYEAFSRDGKTFDRLGHNPLLDLGKGFDKTSIYVSSGALHGETSGTFWINYTGLSKSHEDTSPSFREGGVGRFLLKVDD